LIPLELTLIAHQICEAKEFYCSPFSVPYYKPSNAFENKSFVIQKIIMSPKFSFLVLSLLHSNMNIQDQQVLATWKNRPFSFQGVPLPLQALFAS